jgi:hypothetical protein
MTVEEAEAEATILRDLLAKADRALGFAAQDRARAETVHNNALAYREGLRAAIMALRGPHD